MVKLSDADFRDLMRQYIHKMKICEEGCHLWYTCDDFETKIYVLQVCKRCRRWRNIPKMDLND